MDLVFSLKEAADISAQRDAFLKSVSEFGYDTLIFGMFADPTQSVPAEEMFWIDNVPEGWMQHYAANDYASADVAVAHCLKSDGVLLWQDLFDSIDEGKLEERNAILQKDARDIGLHTGFTKPLIGLGGARAGMSLIARNTLGAGEHQRLFQANQREIEAACDVFYAFSDWRSLGAIKYGLSAREKECLKWLASGLGHKQIADKLGTVPKTIDKQVLSARTKLRARTTAQAVAKAVMWSLIDP
ncbi:MAG: LuxR family transcriptional regulator [Sulfitobacter sp.]